MASPVPYDPVPQIAATDRGVSPMHEDVPSAAFGANIADALTHLGQVEHAAGSELFDRAYAMQTVNITAQANQAQANATDEASKINADYRMKQGNNAVQGYDQFQQDIRATYTKYRNGLDSPIAQKLFDQDSRRNQSYMISGGAMHMAQEGKNYARTTNLALLDQAEQQVFNDPSNEKLFNDNIQHVRDVAAHNAALDGLSPEATKSLVDNAVSSIAVKRVIGLAKTDPVAAQKLLDQSGDLIRMDKAGEVIAKVQQSLNTTGARQEASKLNNGDMSWGTHVTDLNNMSEAIAGIESSNHWIGRHLSPPMSRDYALGRYGIMKSNLPGWLAQAGLPSMTEDQFIADHSAQKQVFNTIFGGYVKKYNGDANLAAVEWFSGDKGVKAYLAGKAGGITDGHTSVPTYLQEFNKNLAKGAGAVDYQKIAETRAGELLPGNTEFQDALQQQLELLHSRQNHIDNETMADNSNRVMDELVQGRQNNQIPTSPDELSPEGKAAFDALDAKKQMAFINAMAQLVKGDYAWAPDGSNLHQFQQLQGIANDPKRTPEETEQFIAADFSNAKFPIAARKQLFDMQQRLLKNEEANPNTAHAMMVLGVTMPSSMPNKKDDPNDYNQFIGSVHEAMTEFTKANAKPMNDKEIQTLGALLTQKIAQEKAGWFGTNIGAGTQMTPMYKIPVPEDAQKAIINDWKADHYGAEPNEEQIHAIFIAHEYQAQVGNVPPKPAATPLPPGRNAPAAPMSQ